MDAKPQRPRATWRVRDENLPPIDAAPNKTIHQRNKSTPALSTLLQVGANKGGMKRAAFADVSNTAGTRTSQQSAKDDSVLPAKGSKDILPSKTALASFKENRASMQSAGSLVKPSTLLRPAQRPSSVLNPKAPSTVSLITDAVASAPPRKPEGEGVWKEPKATKTLSNKTTAVLKELDDRVQPSAAVAEVRQDPSLEPLPQHAPTSQDSTAPGPLQSKNSNETSQVLGATLTTADPVAKATTAVALEGTFAPEVVDFNAQQLIPATYSDLIPLNEPDNSYEVHQIDGLPSSILPEHLESLLALGQPLPELAERRDDKSTRQSVLAIPVAETEEYWDEDEEEEYYDADGYTTARSLRSRGDTTGGVTVIMEPRVTAKVERELAAAQQYVDATKSPEDVEDEAWDTSMVAEYGDEIFQYMKDLELRMKPNPHYMDNQTEIQWSMRAVLMDWLVQVHHRFTLLPETLFLAVNYVDRFLSCKVVSLGKLQLVGATAIFVAAKYEEINCPSVQEIIYMVDGGYTMDEILKAERFMLTMLQFELGWPGPMSFLRRISKADDYDLETRTLAKYFLEVTIMDERFVASAPSFAAAGAHCLARLMLQKGDWSLAHVHYSGYTYRQIRHLVQTILECCEEPRKHHSAVYDKYADKRYKRCSLFVETELQKGFQLPSPARESSGYSQSWRRK